MKKCFSRKEIIRQICLKIRSDIEIADILFGDVHTVRKYEKAVDSLADVLWTLKIVNCDKFNLLKDIVNREFQRINLKYVLSMASPSGGSPQINKIIGCDVAT